MSKRGGWASLLLVSGGLVPPLLLAALLTACERRPVGRNVDEQGPIVARVNGRPVYQKEFESILPEDYERVLTADERKAYLDRWIATQLLYEEASRQGFGVSREIETRLEQYKKDLVADRFVQEVIENRAVVSEREVRAYYEARRNEYTREYRVSHILVNTMEEAEKAKEMLQQRTFSWVARRYSVDKHAGIGGDLGFLSKGNMIPEFEKVVFSMQVGDVSDIIESDFGYHIIKLTDVRDAREKLDYEDAAPEISRTLLLQKRNATYDSLLTAVVSSAQIEVLDPELRLLGDTRVTAGLPSGLPVVGAAADTIADTLSTSAGWESEE
jgi:peptidyl-prolyl cis-trans isomerase C